MTDIAMIDGGLYFHDVTAKDPRYAGYLAATPYVLDLETFDFAAYDAVIVPCRIPPSRMQAHADRLRAYLDGGGTVVSLAATGAQTFLPGVTWEDTPVNFWWWLDPEAEPFTTLDAPDHPLFDHIDQSACTWHHHGVLHPPKGAQALVSRKDGGSLLYVDEVSTNGRLVVSTMDPVFHHGNHFMPGASRFLDGILAWLSSPEGAARKGRPARDAA